jgi:hypothetical protein
MLTPKDLEQEELMNTLKIDYTDDFEAIVDELDNVLDDFPERDYFERAGKLLKEASAQLWEASQLVKGFEYQELRGQWERIASDIDELLGKEG